MNQETANYIMVKQSNVKMAHKKYIGYNFRIYDYGGV